MKTWSCRGCHAHLGRVRRNGSGVRQLLLYREAVGSGENMADVDVMAVVEGRVIDVRCSACGAVRTWVPGQEAIVRLLESCDVPEKAISEFFE